MQIANEDQGVHETVEKEFKQLVNSIIYIKKKSQDAFGGVNTLSTKDILRSLIKITGVDSSIQKPLRKISLKIMRKIIELENKESFASASEW